MGGASAGSGQDRTPGPSRKWFDAGIVLRIYNHIDQKHTLQMAAALAYYFALSLFPALILLSAVVSYLPLHDLFGQTISGLARVLPATSMHLVRNILSDVITPRRATFLSLGFIGTIWTISSGFAATIEALNMAYGIIDSRSFWRIRVLAIEMAASVGALLTIALSVLTLGPRFGEWLASKIYLSWMFVRLWPYLHWTIAIGFTVLAIEGLYFLGPDIKQRFLDTLPGACLSVGCWIGLSYSLGAYFRHFGSLNKTYGTLGAAIALLIWMYMTGFAILLGAELNAQVAKSRGEDSQKKNGPPTNSNVGIAA